jgi:hypothetical protein
MSRKKNLNESELENTQTTLTIEDSNQIESQEAELIAETDAEEAQAAPKARRSRKPKKEEVEPEADAVTEAVEAAEENTKTEDVPLETSEEEITPKRKPRKPRAKKVEAEVTTSTIPELPVATPAPISISAPQPDLQDTLKQWAAIKQLSESVAQLLDKTSHIKSPLSENEFDTGEFFRPQQQKNVFITKFATAASIVAVLLSLVSLSLSQSARQAVLGAMDPIQRSSLAARQNPIPNYPESKIRSRK